MAEKLMRALQYDGYGGGPAGLKHVEVPVPTPSKGEVLLKLEATSINPIDWKTQKGMLRPLLPRKFSFIPGSDSEGECCLWNPTNSEIIQLPLVENPSQYKRMVIS